VGLLIWIGLFVVLTALAGWIVFADGAETTGGLVGVALLGSDVGERTETGIRIFVGATWVFAAIWFVAGLISPGARLGL
jgi:hypothetical protein